MNILIIFVFGLIIGSFLNAVIFRLKANEQFTRGRSKCLSCKHTLSFLDLIPVFSFIFLRAKCRYCHKKISWQYPVIELVTALLFLIGYYYYLVQTVSYLQFMTFLIFTSFLIIIFVYDLKYLLILDKVSISAFLVALILNTQLGYNFFDLMLASTVIAGFFLLQFLISKGKWIGGGDIRMGLVMGAMLGFKMALVALFLAYIIGAVFGIMLLMLKKKSLQSKLAFGTFLSLATFVTLLWGSNLLNWYINIV